MDSRAAYESLMSAVCPSCGGKKQPKRSLCAREYYRLPPALRDALWKPIGSGYEAAIASAIAFLKSGPPAGTTAPAAKNDSPGLFGDSGAGWPDR